MDAKLIVAKGKTSVREIPLGANDMIIGRRTDCALRIPSPLVSRQHCELKCAGSRLIVRDLGSSNGTFVNGSKVKQKELRSGDTLGVGPITFIVQLGAAAVSPSDTAPPLAASGEAADFVVAEELEGDDAADFVVGQEVNGEDESDFVVADEVPAEDEAADFVVAEATDDTEVGNITQAVTTDDEADFVVAAEVSEDNDTVQEAPREPAPKKGRAAAGKQETPAKAPSSKAEAKGGLLGRLFKKKVKKPAEDQAAAAQKGPEKPAKAAKSAPVATPAAVEAAAGPEDDTFFVSDDEATASAKPVGEDELADFLMGLNEKDQ